MMLTRVEDHARVGLVTVNLSDKPVCELIGHEVEWSCFAKQYLFDRGQKPYLFSKKYPGGPERIREHVEGGGHVKECVPAHRHQR